MPLAWLEVRFRSDDLKTNWKKLVDRGRRQGIEPATRNVWLPHQWALIHSRSIMVRSWSSSDIVGYTPGNLVPLEFGGSSLRPFQERLGWVRVERTAPSRRLEQCSRGAPVLWLLAWGAEIKASYR